MPHATIPRHNLRPSIFFQEKLCLGMTPLAPFQGAGTFLPASQGIVILHDALGCILLAFQAICASARWLGFCSRVF
jgi:hypothetical protein